MDICFKEIFNKTEDLFTKKIREKCFPQCRIRLLSLYMGNTKAKKITELNVSGGKTLFLTADHCSMGDIVALTIKYQMKREGDYAVAVCKGVLNLHVLYIILNRILIA